MHELTLTNGERQAIDWVGYRYTNGDDFRDLLFEADWIKEGVEDPDCDWDCPNDLTFLVPEHVAWTINDLFRQEDYTFPCFADSLSSKLMDWVGEIV